MKKLLFLFAVLLTSVGAWAQTVVGALGNPTTTLTDGNYVLVAMSEKGNGATGPCFYTTTPSDRKFQYDLNNPIGVGDAVLSKYVWYVDETTDENGVQHITITKHDDANIFFPADGAKGGNFNGTTKASLKPELKTINGSEYFALTLDDATVGYIHANQASGVLPNLSYWDGYGDGGTCVKFTFHPILELSELNRPFYTSQAPNDMTWRDNTIWYFLQFPNSDDFHTGGYLAAEGSGFISSNGYSNNVSAGKLLITQTEKPIKSSALWCIVGDETNGYKFYNKMNPKLVVGTASDGTAHLYLASETKNGVSYAYDYAPSGSSTHSGCATFRVKGTNKYWNNFDGGGNPDYLSVWDHTDALSDNGSAIRLTQVTEHELAEMAAKLPVASTAEEKRYYTIKNHRSADYATYIGDAAQIKHQARDTESAAQMWYFTADGNGYRMHNLATTNKYTNTSSFTADGAKVWVKENPYCSGFVCISTQENLGGNCWDSGNNNLIGIWNPRATDYEGTSWMLEEVSPTATLDIAKLDAKLHVDDNASQLRIGVVGLAYYVVDGVRVDDPDVVKEAIEAAATIEAVTAIKESYTIAQPSNNFAYKIHGERGFIYVNDSNQPAAVNTADGDASNDIDYDVKNYKHRYAIVTYEEKSYLYSVGAQKFLVRNGSNGVALSDTPAETVSIEASGNATYPWIIKLGGAMINISNGGGHTNSIRIAGTSNPDGGARWAIHEGGGFDASQAIAKIKAYLNNITALNQLSNTATYKVYGERGFIYATEGGELKGTNKHSVTYDEENPYHHFAILNVDENYYLYNVGAKKFVIKNGNTASLSDTPAGQTFAMGAASNLNTAYDWVLRLDGTLTHLSNAVGSGVYVNNSSEDEGTRWAILKVGDFTPDDALYVINNYNRQLYVKAEVEGSWDNNPNTHFGTITATSNSNTFSTKLKTDPIVATLAYNGLAETTTIGFTRAYRGYEFQGYSFDGVDLGKSFTLTDEQKASITAENPLIAKFTATDEVTLFYDDDPFSYRIPAIGKTTTGRLIAVSDYRYSLDDIGRYNYGTATPGIDLVIRMSDDNGKTWGPTKTIAKGSCVRHTNDCAYGDAAIAVVGQKVLVMGAAGDVMFGNGSATAHNRTVRIFSEDNGATWTAPQDISETLFIGENATIKNGYTAFFGSGKLAVDENYNGTGNARIYGAMLIKKEGCDNAIYVIYTDDFGVTWSILGGSQTHITANDEPKVEILPSGQILLSVRRGGGRQFNVFTYSDKATNAGSWNSNVNGCSNGGSNTCNGEIYVVDAKKADGSAVKLLLQSQPKGGSGFYDRRDVTIWYKEITDAAYTSSEIAGNWIQGMQVSTQQSSYSTMVLQDDGKIAFFFEEAPCYGDDQAKGYCMVYTPLTIEGITKGKYFSPTTDLNATQTISVVLTDAQGNEYRDQVESTVAGVAAALATKYPFITMGDNANLESDGETFTYTNTVTLPFKVSNEETTVWHNIYWPANGNDATQRYPVYLSASSAEDTFVPKVTEGVQYGSSSYNTANNADKISWAVYSVGNGFTFKFKNKLTGKFIQATSVADGNAQNVKYVDEANATAFELDNVKEGDKCYGDYALKATFGDKAGYLCSTNATGYHFATHYSGKGHAGAWVKFTEAPDFAALIAEVNATLGMIGTSLGQYTVTAANTEIAATAKTAMQNSSIVKLNELNRYKNLMEGATLNMPKAGTFLRISYDFGNAGIKYLQGVASSVNKANQITPPVSYDGEKGAASIFYYSGSKLLSYTAGTYLREQDNYRGLQGVGVDGGNVTIGKSSRAKGKYTIQIPSYLHANTTNSNYHSDHCSNDAGHAAHDHSIEEVTSLPFTFNSKALGFATFCAPVNVEIPNDVTAYIAEIQGNTLKMRKFVVGNGENLILPAETPVMLYKADYLTEATIELPIVDGEYSLSNEDAAKNNFVGTIAAKNLDGTKFCYSLQVNSEDSNKVGFYSKTTGTKGGFKAWIETDKSQGARTFTIIFDGDDATGLKEALGLENENVEIYDLSGRRLDKPTKGVNVVGGKLVIK